MKLFQIVLLNVVTVVIALVIYDQLRSETSSPSRERASTPRTAVADTADFERRLGALEADRVRAPAADSRVADRVVAPPSPRGQAKPADVPAPEATPDKPRAPASSADDMPTKSEVRRFRKLQEAVRRENAVKKNRAHVDRALRKLSINLTPKQRDQVHHAYAAFQPQVTRIWTEVKTQARETIAAGGVVDRRAIVPSTQARIQTEFAATLGSIFGHPADAEAVSEALMSGGGDKKR